MRKPSSAVRKAKQRAILSRVRSSAPLILDSGTYKKLARDGYTRRDVELAIDSLQNEGLVNIFVHDSLLVMPADPVEGANG